jgi:hypothetical protein
MVDLSPREACPSEVREPGHSALSGKEIRRKHGVQPALRPRIAAAAKLAMWTIRSVLRLWRGSGGGAVDGWRRLRPAYLHRFGSRGPGRTHQPRGAGLRPAVEVVQKCPSARTRGTDRARCATPRGNFCPTPCVIYSGRCIARSEAAPHARSPRAVQHYQEGRGQPPNR